MDLVAADSQVLQLILHCVAKYCGMYGRLRKTNVRFRRLSTSFLKPRDRSLPVLPLFPSDKNDVRCVDLKKTSSLRWQRLFRIANLVLINRIQATPCSPNLVS